MLVTQVASATNQTSDNDGQVAVDFLKPRPQARFSRLRLDWLFCDR